MVRILAVVMLVLLVASGCTFQANNSSEAVTFDPAEFGRGQVISPANGPGYMNGEPMDMRR